jgi:hypothetical protein
MARPWGSPRDAERREHRPSRCIPVDRGGRRGAAMGVGFDDCGRRSPPAVAESRSPRCSHLAQCWPRHAQSRDAALGSACGCNGCRRRACHDSPLALARQARETMRSAHHRRERGGLRLALFGLPATSPARHRLWLLPLRKPCRMLAFGTVLEAAPRTASGTKEKPTVSSGFLSGAYRDRTGDLRLAKRDLGVKP